jgi:hypothetical protein
VAPKKVVEMSKLTIGEMREQVPEGKKQVFQRSIDDAGEERFFQVWQNWDYRPGRIDWLNQRSAGDKPWMGTRETARTPLSTLATPDVRFKGPVRDVVDFYSAGSQVFFVSDRLFRLIEETDPGSLEHIGFELRAKDGAVPFQAVMPLRIVEAIDTQRTTAVVEDQDLAGWWFRTVRFPDGIVFDNDALAGVHSFSDLDAPGWYWSKDLIELAEQHGIRGLFAKSVATAQGPEVARL